MRVAAPVAAGVPGQHLTWDSKTGTGQGRFMLVPSFIKPRGMGLLPPAGQEGDRRAPKNLLAPPPAHIAAAVGRWQEDLWAQERNTPRP